MNLERPVCDMPALANELIKPLFGHRAVAGGIDISTMIGAGRVAVHENAEAHRLAAFARPQHQV